MVNCVVIKHRDVFVKCLFLGLWRQTQGFWGHGRENTTRRSAHAGSAYEGRGDSSLRQSQGRFATLFLDEHDLYPPVGLSVFRRRVRIQGAVLRVSLDCYPLGSDTVFE